MSDTEYQPLQGDPDLLKTKATHYQNIGEAIARSVITLRKIHDTDSMKSKAVDAVRSSADDVAGDIDKAHDRYQQTATALLEYSSSLRTAQDDAARAITDIEAKQTAAQHAHTAATTAQQDADSATDADKSDKATAATKAADAADTADSELRAAQSKWHDAENAKNQAADKAIGLINEVVSGSKKHGLEDSWWDNWGSKLLSVVKFICDIAGVLSIFLAWVPFLGQALLLLAALGALIDLVSAIVAKVQGDGSWGDIFMAAGMAVLTIFGGKLFALAAKQLKAAAIVSTGVKGSKALRELQGVSKGSKEFMSFKAAQKTLRKPLTSAFKAPFRRSEADFALMSKFKSGELTGPEALTKAFKSAFPKPEFDWKGALGINKDLLAAANMAKDSRVIVSTGMKVKAVALTGFQMYTTEQKIAGLGKDITGQDPIDLAKDGLGFAGGSYDKGPEVIGSVRDLVDDFK
ncbi:putative T7SS-secreted protein [Pseudolysinimonas sp.]|uniref:putative T7SS-secreted protein n=1 Tax=Pseudolysinimonas sp. TaxID=2680009 RepID=UPI003F809D0F